MPVQDLTSLHAHIEQLCRDHGILWFRDSARPTQNWAVREFEEIRTAPIRSLTSYAAAMHEIGHVLGSHQASRYVLVRETWAWRWARTHALTWTSAMEMQRQSSLAWYAQRAANLDALRILTQGQARSGQIGGKRSSSSKNKPQRSPPIAPPKKTAVLAKPRD